MAEATTANPTSGARGAWNRVGPAVKREAGGAFFWLCAFYTVYCARPEDWIPGLTFIPLAKITSIFALLSLAFSLGRTKRTLKDLPIEGRLLLVLVGMLVPFALLSPVWRGGAFSHALDFSKVAVAWVLTFLIVTDFKKLQRIIFVQAGSVAVISFVSVIKGRSAPRLEGVLGGIYSNPNDLAFAIVLSLPFCLAFLLEAKNLVQRIAWLGAILAMATALFLTASRAGFIDLVISGSVCLWHFGIRGKRPQLIVATMLIGAALVVVAGGPLRHRFMAISGEVEDMADQKAYGSFVERRELMEEALKGMLHYPVFGVGVHNFVTYSGSWKEVHSSYLQMGVEGGIPALVIYLVFFGYGFKNLRELRRKGKTLDRDIVICAGALHSSLVGFIVGAFFAPEAYQFFPYFAVAQTSVLWAIVREQQKLEPPVDAKLSKFDGFGRRGGDATRPGKPAPALR